jgi:hypothetical protein
MWCWMKHFKGGSTDISDLPYMLYQEQLAWNASSRKYAFIRNDQRITDKCVSFLANK